jgi:hypothetical protein
MNNTFMSLVMAMCIACGLSAIAIRHYRRDIRQAKAVVQRVGTVE